MQEIQNTSNKPLAGYLVGIRRTGVTAREATEHLDELESLADTYGIPVVGREVVTLRQINASYLTGAGKADEIFAMCQGLNADLIIFDDDLSPSQQRNWEKLTKLAVIDRREVNLGIFADRAQTREARLQVALARAEYSLPRLTRAWTHLERQRGGGGARGGAGEAQLEVDRRLVRNQIDKLKRDLQHVRQVRATQRKGRNEIPLPQAAIVGYTNAGKSSLLNAMTGANVLEEDKLFATLDPTTRKIILPNRQPLLLTDTVGFIRKLPHTLVAAFKATLEEAQIATMLIHVVDASHPGALDQRKATEGVLDDLKALDKPTILVLNKVDLLEDRTMLGPLADGYDYVVHTSTVTGEGLKELAGIMEKLSGHNLIRLHLRIPPDRHDLVSLIHREGHIKSLTHDEDDAYTLIDTLLPAKHEERLAEFSLESNAAREKSRRKVKLKKAN